MTDDGTELEPQAHAIIDQRVAILRAWLHDTLTDHPAWCDDLLHPHRHQRVQALLADHDLPLVTPHQLCTLAHRLGLVDGAWHTALRHCLHHGYFDRPRPRPARIDQHQPHAIPPVQPTVDDIRVPVRAILQRTSDRQERITALVREGLCRNRGNAQAVVALIAQNERNAERALVRTCMREGHIPPAAKKPPQSAIDAVTQTIHTVTEGVADRDQHALALVAARVCPTCAAAHLVLDHAARRDTRPDRYDDTIRLCLQRGLFNHLPVRPDCAVVFQRVNAIFTVITDPAHRVQALRWAGLCQHDWQAWHVVAAHTACQTPSDQAVIAHCLHQGWFDRHGVFDHMRTTVPRHTPHQSPTYAIRPPFDTVVQGITLLLYADGSTDQQVQALIALDLCRDVDAAHQVIAALDPHSPDSLVNRIAVSRARHVLIASATHGRIGLLDGSAYAPAAVLLRLQRAIPYLEATSTTPTATLVTLRRDLVALYRACIHVDATLWQRDLLDAPIVSTNREHVQHRITPAQRTQISTSLQTHAGIDAAEAITLYTLLVERGLCGIIDWRCGSPIEQAGHTWDTHRLRRIIDTHLGALPPAARATIAQHVQHLKTAMQATHVTVSLRQLLNSQPFSAFRKRLNRRLPMGYGVVQFFRRKPRPGARRHCFRKPFRDHPQAMQDDPLTNSAALIRQFADQTGLTDQAAAQRLYQVRTSGGIGFLPQETWLTLVDHRLLALLKFYAFVRIDGRLDIHQALRQVNHYATQLGLSPLSPQLARALRGAMHKPGRWNGAKVSTPPPCARMPVSCCRARPSCIGSGGFCI